MPTNISWVRGDDGSPGETWNPVVGCEYTSPGCLSCYAARDAASRLKNVPAYQGLAIKPGSRGPDAEFTGLIRTLPERLDQPLHWRDPRRIFVCSMSDLFHPGVLKEMQTDCHGATWPFLAEVFAVMVRAHWHQFQILTKRPQIMAAVLREPRFRLDVNAILLRDGHPVMPGGMTGPSFRWPGHIWAGTSIENNRYTFRADHLRATPAKIRFISAEPLLGPLPSLNLDGIDWLICGGESGPRARPMDPAWAADLRDRCAQRGIAFHFKQAGTVLARQWGMTDRKGHTVSEMPAEFQVQEWPA